jgi:pimeloyl-ACP methyl ester carboxylesterase
MASMEYDQPKMVGRDLELDQLKRYLQATVKGKGNTVFVSGEAGIGKTRLVKELERYAESLKVKILEGQCLYASSTPFLPFRDALRSVFQVSKSDALPLRERKISKVIKESAPQFVQAIPVVGNLIAGVAVAYRTYKDGKGKEGRTEWGGLFERDEGLETISDLLVAISEKQPLLLSIDDLHWADTPSLSLLHYLARHVANSKILVVGTYRPEEVTETYEGTVHPLLETLQRMSIENLFQKIELERLNQANYSDFVSSILGVRLDDLARLVYGETEGNPFFAIETIRWLMQQSVLTKVGADWKLSENVEKIEIPPRVYDVVVRRLNALRDKEREILDCASVMGEEFSFSLVQKVLSLNRIELLKNLSAIERKHHLVHSFEGGCRFDHSKIRETLYDEIPLDLRKEYHSMVAACIEEESKGHLHEVVNELAYHYYQGGNVQKAVPYLVKAGEDAREKWAVFEAVKFFSEALEMMGNDKRWSKDRTRTLEALGDVYAFIGQHEKANECYSNGMATAKNDAVIERMFKKTRKKMVLDKNGVKLAYYMYGEGQPTLVFLVAWIWTAEFWQPQVNYFSQNFQMVTIDMRGTGDSDKPAGDYTLDLYADDLDSIIDGLHEKNIVLIGESIGASIAIKYVTKYPGKVSKLVLIGGSPKFITTDDFPLGWSLDKAQALRASAEQSWPTTRRAFLEMIFSEPGTNYLREWGDKMAQKTPAKIATNAITNLFQADLRPLLRKIDVPTLILHGEKDILFTYPMDRPIDFRVSEGAKYIRENISGSKNYIFEGRGHFPSITAPDKFNKVLKEFIMTGKLLTNENNEREGKVLSPNPNGINK